MVKVDEIPEIYRFLPGSDRFVRWDQVSGDFDLALFLDCGDPSRTGPALAVARRAKVSVNIDHHVTNTHFGDYNYVDPGCSSVGEQIYRLLNEANIPLDKDIAACLYTSIITDTGGFRYENTTVDTHLVAAHLLTFDVQPQAVSQAIYERKTLSSLRLQALALGTLQVGHGGETAWMEVTREMLDRVGSSDEETDGLINYARSIQGVEVGLFFRELPDGGIRVGFRSKGRVDVSRVAADLGGGGHPRAAGCSLAGPLAQARERVLEAIEKALGNASSPAPPGRS